MVTGDSRTRTQRVMGVCLLKEGTEKTAGSPEV